MELNLPTYLAEGYKNLTQIARRVTEPWALMNLYCPGCGGQLEDLGNNTKVADFKCPSCRDNKFFQLKSQSRPFGKKLTGAEYNTTLKSFIDGIHPSLILLQYTLPAYTVKNVFLLHRDYITISCIQARKPLVLTARRAGWQGCHFLLDQIPDTGKIVVVNNGIPTDKSEVLKQWRVAEASAS